MHRLSEADYATVVDFLDDLYRARDAMAFADWLVQSLGGLVGSNLTSWNRMIFSVPRAEVRSDPEPDDRERVLDGFQRRLLEHPCVRHHMRTGSLEPLMISDFLSAGRFHRLGLYDEVYRLLGVEDQIGISVGQCGGETTAVAVSRDRRSFGERERALLATLRPHIARAYDNARVVTRWQRQSAAAGSAETAAQCAVLLDERDRPRELPAVAARWLGEHFGDEVDLARGALPAAVLRWLRARAPADRGPLVQRGADRVLVVRCLLDPAAPRPTNVLLLERHRLAESAARLRAQGLTHREIEVLCILEQGLTNEEIGGRLSVSPLTVKKHLERIYRKLGVRNRTEAVARLRDERQG